MDFFDFDFEFFSKFCMAIADFWVGCRFSCPFTLCLATVADILGFPQIPEDPQVP